MVKWLKPFIDNGVQTKRQWKAAVVFGERHTVTLDMLLDLVSDHLDLFRNNTTVSINPRTAVEPGSGTAEN